jgi:hypothetical protein
MGCQSGGTIDDCLALVLLINTKMGPAPLVPFLMHEAWSGLVASGHAKHTSSKCCKPSCDDDGEHDVVSFMV